MTIERKDTGRTSKVTFLAPGVPWETVEKKLDRSRKWCENQFKIYTSFPEFAWLRGKVWADAALFSEYRGVILAEAKFAQNLATYARVPHTTQKFYDPESDRSTNILGEEVQSDPSKTQTGLDELGESLARVVGKEGRVDKHSLTYLWGCWDDTAQKVIGQLVSRGVLQRQPLSEYVVNPELVDEVKRTDALRE